MLPPTSTAPLDKGKSPSVHSDDAIRSTDDDAAASRMYIPSQLTSWWEANVRSAVTQGYLTDPFLPLLYKPKFAPGVAGPSRKPPLINVGTHHRSYGIDLLVDQFLEQGGRQVVSLGAGSDTRFWRIRSRDSAPGISHYVELDFPHLTSQKAQRIMRSPKLKSFISPSGEEVRVTQGGAALSSSLYSLLPVDLRSPGALDVLKELLDPEVPTLLLAECVFCYMTPTESEAVLKWFEGLKDLGVVVYEMCGLDDQFGQVMRRNLASRKLSLPGAIYPTPTVLAERFLAPSLGEGIFEKAGGKSLWEIREGVIPPKELSRISRLEHLDEIEELRLVLRHYAIAWGTRGAVTLSL